MLRQVVGRAMDPVPVLAYQGRSLAVCAPHFRLFYIPAPEGSEIVGGARCTLRYRPDRQGD